MRGVFALLPVFLLAGAAAAAVVEGVVYGPDLQPIAAIVSVNTQPRQTVVAANGSYSLQLPDGEFELTAVAAENSSLAGREAIRVAGVGTYAIDFVLVGDDASELADALRELDELAAIEDEALQERPDESNFGVAAAIALVVLAAIAFAYSRWQQARGEQAAQREAQESRGAEAQAEVHQPAQQLTSDEKQVLAELANAGGLLSQKQLRQKLHFWSEARVSLVVSALEKQGRLKSLKQGRGNILKLLE